MRKALLILIIFIALIIGAYYAGYKVGSSDTQVKYIIQEREATHYVQKNKDQIYSKPNINRDTALQLFYQGKL